MFKENRERIGYQITELLVGLMGAGRGFKCSIAVVSFIMTSIYDTRHFT